MAESPQMDTKRYNIGPQDGRILEFFQGQFEAVYVLLSPFYVVTRPDSPMHDINYNGSKQESLTDCSRVSWQEVMTVGGFKNLSEIDIGLKTNIHRLKPEYQDQAAADRLNFLTKDRGIWQPAEGFLSPFLENHILKAFQYLGIDELWVGDELGDIPLYPPKIYNIDELITQEIISFSNDCLYTQSHDLLLTTHWDSHYSLLCSSRENIERILAFHPFEGFYCTAETEVDWSVWNMPPDLAKH